MIIIEAKENYVDIMQNKHVNCLQYGLFRKGAHSKSQTYIAIHTYTYLRRYKHREMLP